MRLRGQDLALEQVGRGEAVLRLWGMSHHGGGGSCSSYRPFNYVKAYFFPRGRLDQLSFACDGQWMPLPLLFLSLVSVPFDKYPLMSLFSICIRYFCFFFFFKDYSK